MEEKERMGAAGCAGEEGRSGDGGEKMNLWSRIETAGEKWVSAFLERADAFVSEFRNESAGEASHRVPRRLADWNHALEERMHRALERLNLPTKADWEATNHKIEDLSKHWREDLQEQIRKGVARLPFATRGSLENVAAEVRSLRGQVDELLHPVKPRKKPGGPKMAEA